MRADLRAALDLVDVFPFLGAAVFEDYRHVPLRVFPYMVVYRVVGEAVRVLAVVHTRRDPTRIQRLLEGRQVDEAGDASIMTVLPPETQ
jgi:plasmid stabilization system protein ParE